MSSAGLDLLRCGGRFTELQQIGEGGHGIVYSALDAARAERVALKVLKRDGPSNLEQFKSEFRGLTELTHENLPLLYELFTDGGEWFFTMELVHGEDPRAWVSHGEASTQGPEPRTGDDAPASSWANVDEAAAAQRRRPDLQRLTDLIAQLERVLAFVHERGFVHGDVKPTNVRVRPNGSLVLLDFGLMAATDVARRGFAGTTLYAAPELLAKEHVVGAAQDLYALGAVAFELATGAPPFPGLGLQPMLDKNRRPAPSLAEVAPDVPHDLAAQIGRWLEREPTARGPNASTRRGATSLVDADSLLGLGRAYARAARGHSVFVDVEGASNLGRAALLERFLSDRALEDRPPEVFRSRASPREHLPFGALDGILASLELHLDLARPRTRVDLARELHAALSQRAGDATVILAIDDAHWIDPDSAAVLAELFFPPRLRSLLLIFARQGDGARFTAPGPTERIVLSAGDARAREPELRGGDLDDRIGSLDEAARHLLELVAMSRAELPVSTLARLDRTVPASRILESLSRLDLVRRALLSRSVTYVPASEAVRTRVLRDLGTNERRTRHEALASSLDRHDVEALAEHLDGAGRTEEARALLLNAASEAAPLGAHGQAARLLEAALSITPEPAARREIGDALLTALERGGLTTAAARTAVALAEDTPPGSERRIVYQVRAAKLFLVSGELADGHALLASLSARFEMRWPRSEAETFVRTALAPHTRPPPITSNDERRFVRAVAEALALIDPQRGYLFQARALADARARREPRQLAAALLGEVCYATARGRGESTAVREHLAELDGLFPGGLPDDLAVVRQFAVALLDHHRVPSRRAVDALLAAERAFGQLPNVDVSTLGMVGLIAGHGLQLIGDLPGLRRQSERLARAAERRHDAFLRTTARFGGHRGFLGDDAPEISRHMLTELPWAEDPSGFHLQHWLRAEAEIETSLYEGDAEGGWRRIEATRRLLAASLLRRDRLVKMCCDFVYGRAVIALIAMRSRLVGPTERLLLERATRDLEGSPSAAARVRGAMLRASLAGARDDPRAARGHLQRALDLARAIEHPLFEGELELAMAALDPARSTARGLELLRAQGVIARTRFGRVDLPGLTLA